MIFLRRLSIYILIILLFVSIYKDLTIGQATNLLPVENNNLIENDMNDFKILKIRVQPGDTVLSIVEKINHSHMKFINIEQIVNDFKLINPFVNPYNLEPNKYYFFPLYSI